MADDVVADIGLGQPLVDDVDRGVAVAGARDHGHIPGPAVGLGLVDQLGQAGAEHDGGGRRGRGDHAADHGRDADPRSSSVEGGPHAGGGRRPAAPDEAAGPSAPHLGLVDDPSGPPGRPGPDDGDDDDQRYGQPERDGQGRGRRQARVRRGSEGADGAERAERREHVGDAQRGDQPDEHRRDGWDGGPAGDLAAGGAERPQAALHLAVAAGLPGHDEPGDRHRGEGRDEGEGLQGDHRGTDGLAHGGVEVGAVLGDVVVADAHFVELGRQLLVEPVDRLVELAADRRRAVGAVAQRERVVLVAARAVLRDQRAEDLVEGGGVAEGLEARVASRDVLAHDDLLAREELLGQHLVREEPEAGDPQRLDAERLDHRVGVDLAVEEPAPEEPDVDVVAHRQRPVEDPLQLGVVVGADEDLALAGGHPSRARPRDGRRRRSGRPPIRGPAARCPPRARRRSGWARSPRRRPGGGCRRAPSPPRRSRGWPRRSPWCGCWG